MRYLVGRLRGGDVAGIGSQPEGAGEAGRAGTPTSGSTAPTRPPRRSTEAGGSVLMDPFDISDAGRMAVVRRPGGRRRSASGRRRPARRADRQRAGQLELQRPQHPRPLGREGVLRRASSAGRRPTSPRARRSSACPPTATTSRSATPACASGWRTVDAPERFEETVAWLRPNRRRRRRRRTGASRSPSTTPTRPPQRATELGGEVLVPPLDAPWVRMTVLRDPRARRSPRASSSRPTD